MPNSNNNKRLRRRFWPASIPIEDLRFVGASEELIALIEQLVPAWIADCFLIPNLDYLADDDRLELTRLGVTAVLCRIGTAEALQVREDIVQELSRPVRHNRSPLT